MAISFLIQEAFRSLFRAKRLNAISLGAMSMSLMALGMVLILNISMIKLTEFIENKIEVVLFLDQTARESEIPGFITKIQDHPQVIEARFISREQALAEFSEDAALQDLLKVLGNNPLPSSVRINLMEKTPENVERFIAWLKKFPGVEDVGYGGGDVNRLLKALQFIKLAVMILTVSLVVAAVVIVANIISLMVYARQEEIRIMRLIGATNGFIQGPFVLWGMIQGTTGGVIATGLLYTIWAVLQYYTHNELGIDLASLLPANIQQLVLSGSGILIAAGCLLGLVGSLVSVGRRLDE
ncbi:permease-like cell division protein FtsX [bacterium]|nr:permease-like cell division protein FtsX [bacterium]